MPYGAPKAPYGISHVIASSLRRKYRLRPAQITTKHCLRFVNGMPGCTIASYTRFRRVRMGGHMYIVFVQDFHSTDSVRSYIGQAARGWQQRISLTRESRKIATYLIHKCATLALLPDPFTCRVTIASKPLSHPAPIGFDGGWRYPEMSANIRCAPAKKNQARPTGSIAMTTPVGGAVRHCTD
jgi:hypothetical protein